MPILATAWLQNSKNKHEGAPQIGWSLDMLDYVRLLESAIVNESGRGLV